MKASVLVTALAAAALAGCATPPVNRDAARPLQTAASVDLERRRASEIMRRRR
ncbi:MAG: hypothetical protein K2Q06_02230 [Parvularculaceae bacterium]|nr:hypothetical protein [Parvularculaceae bacterium]